MHKRIEAQLVAYYKSKGLKGAALNSCVKRDYKLVVKESGWYELEWPEDTTLSYLMWWKGTEQGHDYWEERHNASREAIQ